MSEETFGNSAQKTRPNIEITMTNINTSTVSNCHHVTCCCRKVCKRLRGSKMHQRNCQAIKDLQGETFEIMQENMSELSDHNIDFELDAEYESEMGKADLKNQILTKCKQIIYQMKVLLRYILSMQENFMFSVGRDVTTEKQRTNILAFALYLHAFIIK